MKSVALITLLFVLAIAANGESPEQETEVRQDTVQDVEQPIDEDKDNSIASHNDEDTLDEDSITKVCQLERKLERKHPFVHSQIYCTTTDN